MTREHEPLSTEVRALLDHEREITPLPATVRARAVARARAALVAGVARADRSIAVPPRPRWAAAAAVIGILSVGVGAAAYQFRAYLAPAPANDRPGAAPAPRPAPPPAPVAAAQEAQEVQEVQEVEEATPATAADKPTPSRADQARAELRLLRQARAAVAREDYAAALPQIAEHAHRFKDGRLTEEREALRVKALVGLGRTAEAHRAAAAFRARFPRSVLLSAVNKMSPSEP
jgi:hypothetical protein